MLSSKCIRIRDIRFVFVFENIRTCICIKYKCDKKNVIRIRFHVNPVRFHPYFGRALTSAPPMEEVLAPPAPLFPSWSQALPTWASKFRTYEIWDPKYPLHNPQIYSATRNTRIQMSLKNNCMYRSHNILFCAQISLCTRNRKMIHKRRAHLKAANNKENEVCRTTPLPDLHISSYKPTSHQCGAVMHPAHSCWYLPNRLLQRCQIDIYHHWQIAFLASCVLPSRENSCKCMCPSFFMEVLIIMCWCIWMS
jgi:hypothetical protein